MKTPIKFSFFALVYAVNAVRYASEEQFKYYTESESITFVNFGTKWCQHCRDLEETCDRVRTETSNLTEVVILTVDCDDLQEICETAEIKDFPTLALFKNSKDGKSVKQFSSQESRGLRALVNAVIDFVNTHNRGSLEESGGIMFYPDPHNFYQGDELPGEFKDKFGYDHELRDFWVGDEYETPKAIEEACRSKCVENIPKGCNAYSVKVQDPMKGQCYLKTKPKIANGNKYDAVFAVQYNSGVISAREFSHCYTNVYGKESVYESNKDPGEGNGCWTYDEESKKCMIDENSECLELECRTNEMWGAVRPLAFHDNSILNATTGEILRKVEFNRNGTTVECNQKVTYNKTTSMIEFTIPLGDCNMITTASSKFDSGKEESYIQFIQQMSFLEPKPLNGSGETRNSLGVVENGVKLFLADSYTGSVTFKCNYRAQTEPEGKFEVVTRIFNGEIEKFVNWGEVSTLEFYFDESFSNPVDPKMLNIGFPVYFQSKWEVQFIEQFPVRFYANKCKVVDNRLGKEYHIIKDGCGSILANTQVYSNDVFQKSDINFSFRSFSFSQGDTTYNLQLVCSIFYCLVDEDGLVNQEDCGYNPDNCPNGYQNMKP